MIQGGGNQHIFHCVFQCDKFIEADSDYIEDPLKGLSVDRLLSFEYLLAGFFIALMSWLITVMIIGYKIGNMVKNNEINDLSDSERKQMDYFFNKRKNW